MRPGTRRRDPRPHRLEVPAVNRQPRIHDPPRIRDTGLRRIPGAAGGSASRAQTRPAGLMHEGVPVRSLRGLLTAMAHDVQHPDRAIDDPGGAGFRDQHRDHPPRRRSLEIAGAYLHYLLVGKSRGVPRRPPAHASPHRPRLPDSDRAGLDRPSRPQPVMRAPERDRTTTDGGRHRSLRPDRHPEPGSTCPCGPCSSATPSVPDSPDPGTGTLTLDLTTLAPSWATR